MPDPHSPELDDSRVTFLLPVSGRSDLQRARRNLLPSIDAFFQREQIGEILVLSPDAECGSIHFEDVVSAEVAERIRVVPETNIAGDGRPFRTARGWHKQQILKLLAGESIGTRLYCTLDADVYLVRPCSLADWVGRGACVYNPGSLDLHRRWWRRAAKRLGYRLHIQPTDGFGVTPSLLYTNIVRRLVDYLEAERGGVVRAIRRGATEYTLYWLFVKEHYNSQALYEAKRGPLYGRCLWKHYDARRNELPELVQRQFSGQGDFYFSLIQSTSGLASDDVVARIESEIRSRAARGSDIGRLPACEPTLGSGDFDSAQTMPAGR